MVRVTNTRVRLPVSWLLPMLLCAAVACQDSNTASNNAATSSGTLPASAAGGAAPAQPAADGLVHLASGDVQGDVVDGARRYLKIPYAKPPVGALRWAAPQKPDAWTAVRHETAFTQACSQNMSSGSMASLNEDCLYLNVWQPLAAATAAPVMVWIHGGGNFAGGTDDKVPTSTDQYWFDGHMLAERYGLIVVTLNYRLGPLGFFAHPDLAAEGSNVGNQGLLDQNMALHWVHDNIAAFGGDASNVTIFGESAGSSDVCYHVASPRSVGLFSHAISESGGCTGSPLGSEASAAQALVPIQAFAKALGCATGQLACLRQQPIADVMQNAMQPDPTKDSNGGTIAFSVVVDGAGGFLPKPARAIFDAGEMNHVAYILGSNNDEGTIFLLGTTGPTTDADYQTQLTARFGALAAQVGAQYPAAAFGGDQRAALARAVGDSGLVCGTHDSARRAVKAGLTVFMYNFNVPWAVGSGALGAAHSSEIGHVFDLPFMPDAASQQVADVMSGYWARFARSGDPNGGHAPTVWPRFQPDAADSDRRLQFDASFAVVDDFRKTECTFWRQTYDAAAATP
jgi:para-nitrobenzyl esterase